MKTSFLQNKHINRIFWIIILLAAWQLTAMSGLFSPLIFPSLPTILKALFISVTTGEILNQIWFSLIMVLAGLILALAAAVILSSLSIYSKAINNLVETISSIFSPLPGIALLPLIILWLGTGSISVLFIIIHSAIWPMLFNVLTGFKTMPPIYRQVGLNIGLSRVSLIWYIMFPASLPYLLAGIRTGWSRAWRALISAEMIFGAVSGSGGLGWYIFKQRTFMDTPGMFAGIVVIIVIGIIMEDVILNWIEGITIKKWGMMS